MKPNIFEFHDYKRYLSHWVKSQSRGAKSRIAREARCHLAYISQVLTGRAHFNLEQADALNELLEHGEDEAQFFLLLVEFGRAGTHSLKQRFQKQIQKALDQRLQLKNRFTDKKALTLEHQTIYYSHWAYCAVHMAVLNPKLRTAGAIATYLGVSGSETVKILDFLESVGLIRKTSEGFAPGDIRIHLDHDSPMISKHHTNWRLQAMRSLERPTQHELHYSGVISVSRDDLPNIRESLVRALEQIRATVKHSKDETVYCYSLDLFGLGQEAG